jgi:hypothetical protein
MIKSKRLGKFNVPLFTLNRNSKYLRVIMGLCIILEARPVLHEDRIEYTATSEEFDEIKPGEQIPTYEWMFKPKGTSVRAVRWGEETSDCMNRLYFSHPLFRPLAHEIAEKLREIMNDGIDSGSEMTDLKELLGRWDEQFV